MNAFDGSARHPIGVVVDRTGLSQDVIRVWERRYGAVAPARGAGGHRLYSDADVARLRLLHDVTRAGRTIGQVATLETEALVQLAAEDAAARRPFDAGSEPAAWTPEVDAAFAATLALDPAGVDAVLRRAVSRAGLEVFIADVAVPLLRRIGDGWHLGDVTIAQEHVASAVVQDILLDSMRGTVAPRGAERLVVGTLAGERHAIGAALIAARAAADGWEVIYLGADLPAAEIAGAALSAGARAVAVSMVYVTDRARARAALAGLRERLPETITIAVGGAAADALDLPPGTTRTLPGMAPLMGTGPRMGTNGRI